MTYLITFIICYFASFVGYWWGKASLYNFDIREFLWDGWAWRACCGLLGISIQFNISNMLKTYMVTSGTEIQVEAPYIEELIESDFAPVQIIGFPLPDNYVDDEIHS